MVYNFFIELPKTIDYDVFDYKGDSKDLLEDDYVYYRFESIILDPYRNVIKEDELLNNYLNSGKKFVILLNINPNTIEGEAYEEIKFLVNESVELWRQKNLDNESKLKITLKKDFKLQLSNGDSYILKDCKIFEDYSDDNFKLYFAMLVDNVEKEIV